MGITYEMNWYLVVSDEKDIAEVGEGVLKTTKKERRIYPIGAPIPLIIKNKGCVAFAEIVSFEMSDAETIIKFKISDKYKNDKIILRHYYDMFLSAK